VPVVTIEAVLCPDPQEAEAVLEQGVYILLRQAVLYGEVSEQHPFLAPCRLLSGGRERDRAQPT